MAAAVILALLMLAIPIVPTIGATGTIIITNPATKTGPPGTAVTLTCTGFTGGQTYTVYFGATVVTSGSTVTGAFTAYFDVPSSPRGVYNVTVITTAPDDSNTVTYTVTPDVTANVSTANVGDTVTVSGTGFAASTSVTIYFDGVSEGTDTTNTTGNFTGFTFTVPATVEGTYIIEAEETYATRTQLPSLGAVLTAPQPSPSLLTASVRPRLSPMPTELCPAPLSPSLRLPGATIL